MEPIRAAIAATRLSIEWFKERRQARQDVDADAFRAWLTEVAFPPILDASEATFELLSISQASHHAELLGYLDSQIRTEGQTPRGPVGSRWRRYGGGPLRQPWCSGAWTTAPDHGAGPRGR